MELTPRVIRLAAALLVVAATTSCSSGTTQEIDMNAAEAEALVTDQVRSLTDVLALPEPVDNPAIERQACLDNAGRETGDVIVTTRRRFAVTDPELLTRAKTWFEEESYAMTERGRTEVIGDRDGLRVSVEVTGDRTTLSAVTECVGAA